ncbi:MAG: hypothetical protein JWO93_3257 [Micrococcaceae bacterium]|nr:hypothetical protein [Micrococcaceae bacterium]
MGRRVAVLRRRRPRLLPATASGLLSVLLGAAAHVAAGASLPPFGILMALAAFTVLAAALASTICLPFWAVMLLLGLGQQVLHLLLDATATPLLTGPVISGGHHAETPAGTLASAGSAMPAMTDPMLMSHGHIAAALLVALILRRGWASPSWWRSRRWFGRTRLTGDPSAAGVAPS